MTKPSVYDAGISEIEYGGKSVESNKTELRVHNRSAGVFSKNNGLFENAEASSEDEHLKFYSGSYAKASFN